MLDDGEDPRIAEAEWLRDNPERMPGADCDARADAEWARREPKVCVPHD